MTEKRELRLSSNQQWDSMNVPHMRVSLYAWTNTCSDTLTYKHRHKPSKQPSNMSSAPHLYSPPLSYNFTPINLTHLITVPAPRPQRSHILHTPLPPFWAQPQLWNPKTNNSLACYVPPDLLTIPPATNYVASHNPKVLSFLRYKTTDIYCPFAIYAYSCISSFVSSYYTVYIFYYNICLAAQRFS